MQVCSSSLFISDDPCLALPCLACPECPALPCPALLNALPLPCHALPCVVHRSAARPSVNDSRRVAYSDLSGARRLLTARVNDRLPDHRVVLTSLQSSTSLLPVPANFEPKALSRLRHAWLAANLHSLLPGGRADKNEDAGLLTNSHPKAYENMRYTYARASYLEIVIIAKKKTY